MAELTEIAGLPVLPALRAPGVRSFVTTRRGGAGAGPHESLNLGVKAGDDPAVVAENRRRLRAALPGEPFWLSQVHGARVLDADAHQDELPTDAAGTLEGVPPLPASREADASFTAAPGRVLAIMVADCLPVVMADLDGRVLGAAHAGWRGLAGGVLENTLAGMRARHPGARGWQAWIGPGIGPRAFEVGDDVREAFAGLGAEALAAFVPYPGRPGKWLADLPSLAELRLRRAGVAHIGRAGLCTVENPELFFSYRRDGVTGRMALCAWLEAAPLLAPDAALPQEGSVGLP